MGCDIHMYVEYFWNEAYIDYVDRKIKMRDTWLYGGDYYKNPFYLKDNYLSNIEIEKMIRDPAIDYFLDGDVESVYSEYLTRELPINRDYQLFEYLAGVRGGVPFIKPRGLPPDVTPEVKKIYDSWGMDAHTPHYYTLKELIAHYGAYESHLNPQFDSIIKHLKEKAEFLLNITPSQVNDNVDKIRIVFWFDN